MALPTDKEKDPLQLNGTAPLQKAATPPATPAAPVKTLAPATGPEDAAKLTQPPPGMVVSGGQKAEATQPPASPPAAPKGVPPTAPAAASPIVPTAIDSQAASDRKSIGDAWNAAKDMSDSAGRAIFDIATLAPRGVVGAYDSAVVRPMRAAGLDAAYLSPKLVPSGVDPSSMTPFMDQKRMAQDATGAAAAAQNPTGTVPLPAGMTPSTAGAGRGAINPPLVDPTAPPPSMATPPAAAQMTGWDRGNMSNADVAAANPAGQVRAVRGANGVMEFSGNNITGPVSYTDAQGKAHEGAGINGRGWGGFDVAPAGAEVATGANGSYAFANNNPIAAVGQSPAGTTPPQAQGQGSASTSTGNGAQQATAARPAAGGPPVVQQSNAAGQPMQPTQPYAMNPLAQPQASQATQAATSAALAAAAERGDWDAVRAHYATQGQGFGGQSAGQIQNQLANAPRMQEIGTRNAFGFDPQKRNAEMRQNSLEKLATDPNAKRSVRQGALELLKNGEGDDARQRARLASEERRAAENNRAGMDQTTMREQGENLRAGARNAIAAGELGIRAQDSAQQGDVRAAELAKVQRANAITQRYDAAKTDEERATIISQYPDVFGQKGTPQGAQRFITVGGGTSVVDGQTVREPTQVFDTVTQRMVNTPGAQGGQQAAAPKLPIDKNPDAIAIARNTDMSREEKAQALSRLGY